MKGSIFKIIYPIKHVNQQILVLDQRQLPEKEHWIILTSTEDMINVIQNLAVRGAPLLGLAGIYGLYLASLEATSQKDFTDKAEQLRNARPTAVNLSKTIDNTLKKRSQFTQIDLSKFILREATLLEKDLQHESSLIASNGISIINDNDTILTHCNTGSLATFGLGTALGVIKASCLERKNISVFFTETRPLMQGSRLTYWELEKNNIQSTMIIDDAVGFFMNQNKIQKVIVGADRIALNGDTANKIGTYSIAVLAKENAIPFYIAAPISTIDFSLQNGDQIPIEYRNPAEISIRETSDKKHIILNPAFDVTPHQYISGFITEKGIISPPFE